MCVLLLWSVAASTLHEKRGNSNCKKTQGAVYVGFDQRLQVHTISGVGFGFKTLGVVFSRNLSWRRISSGAMHGCANCRHSMSLPVKWGWTRKSDDFSRVSRTFSRQTRMVSCARNEGHSVGAKQRAVFARQEMLFQPALVGKKCFGQPNLCCKKPQSNPEPGSCFLPGAMCS